MRIDSFVQKHVDYLRGALKIVDGQSNTNNIIVSFAGSEDISLTSTPVKEHNSDINLTLDSNSCPACKNNDKPSGAHICQLCNKYVHALPQCSIPFEDAEEGYGQPRVCIMCKDNVHNIKDILASREVENWRGQVKINKNALYLGKNPHKVMDALTCKKAAKILILKNGNNTSLKSLKIQNDNYTVTNTCTFDSIFQILLAAGHDNHHILQHMDEVAERNLFFKLIMYTVRNGISQHVYKLRAQILSEIFPISDIGGCKYINCETNVGYLASALFKETPSFIETSQCNLGCPPRYKKLSVVQIEERQITDENFNEIVTQSVCLEGEHPCCTKHCTGLEKTTLSETGKYFKFFNSLLNINETDHNKLYVYI